MEEEDETAGRLGETRRPLTKMVGDLEGSGAEDAPGGAASSGGAVSSGGAASSGGATANATSGDVAAAGVGGRHGAGIGERVRDSGRRKNPSGKSYGVGHG